MQEFLDAGVLAAVLALLHDSCEQPRVKALLATSAIVRGFPEATESAHTDGAVGHLVKLASDPSVKVSR